MASRVFIAILLTMMASRVGAVEFTYGSIDPDRPAKKNAIIMTGEIRKGDYDVLRRFAAIDKRGFHPTTVVLASQGGDLIEAIRIGEFIRKTYMDVFVNPKIGRCASACFLIYVAAVQRDAVAPGLGFHRPYFAASEFERLPLQDAERKHRQLLQSVRSYLEGQQVPVYLIEKMFSLASTEIYWLTEKDIDQIGTRAYWWEQVLVDRCNLQKELEREYLLHGDRGPRAKEALKHIGDVAGCAYDISRDERLRNLNQLLAEPK